MAENSEQFPTILGPDAKFKGELTFEKGLRLQGQLEGKITTTGRLHVAKDAKMFADVEAGAIIVEGEVKGALNASDRIELKATSNYEGNLTAAKLVVDEGARFIGQVTVGPDVPKNKPAGSPGINRPQSQPQPQGQPQANKPA